MNRKALNTRRVYTFEQILRPMPKRMVKEYPIGKLRELALRVWRGEGARGKPPVVVAGRGIACSSGLTSYNEGRRIELARHHRAKLVLIHEMVHFFSYGSHGPRFMRMYAYLLVRYCGYKHRWVNAAWNVARGTHDWTD